MHVRMSSLCAFLLACQLAPLSVSAAPKVHPLDQPRLDKDGMDYKPLSIQPPPAEKPVKLSRRERLAAQKAARADAKASAADDATAASGSESEPQATQVASLDPAAVTGASEPKALPPAIAADTPKSGVRSLIAQHAAANGVPFHLADAMVKIESRYNPRARNGVNLGLGQINLRTAQSLGYRGGAAGLFDANTNLTYSVKYLAQAYRLAKGDICGAVTRYQNGFGATRMNGANRSYCAKVKAHQG